MNITQHATSNAVLAAPANMPIEQCRAAPITRVMYEDGAYAIRTYWKPTAAELELLMLGGLVEVEVLGTSMPPLAVKAES